MSEVGEFMPSDITLTAVNEAIEEYRKYCGESMNDLIEARTAGEYKLIHILDTGLVFFDGNDCFMEKFEGIEKREPWAFVLKEVLDQRYHYIKETMLSKGLRLVERLQNGMLFKSSLGKHVFVTESDMDQMVENDFYE